MLHLHCLFPFDCNVTICEMLLLPFGLSTINLNPHSRSGIGSGIEKSKDLWRRQCDLGMRMLSQKGDDYLKDGEQALVKDDHNRHSSLPCTAIVGLACELFGAVEFR